MKKSTNTKSNILAFNKSFFHCYEKAKEYLEDGLFADALLEANNALDMECNAEILILLGEIYYKMQYDEMALHCGCQILGTAKPNEEIRNKLVKLIPVTLSELGHTFGAFFYLVNNSKELSKPISEAVPLEEIQEEVQNLIQKELEEDGENNEFPHLCFADEKKEAYNKDTFKRAFDLVQSEEWSDAKYLLNSMYENTKYYSDGRRLLALIFSNEGDSEKASRILEEEFEKDKTNSAYIIDAYDLGKEYFPLLKKMIDEFVIGENEDAVLDVINIANLARFDDKALELAEELCETYSGDIKPIMLKVFAMWNLGKVEEAKHELFKLLYSFRFYYPAQYIKKIRFPKRFSLDFSDLPIELLEKLNNAVIKTLLSDEEQIKEEETLRAIIFLLKNSDEDFDCVDLLHAIELSGEKNEIIVYKRIASTFSMPYEIQKYAIRMLVDKCRTGTVQYNNDGLIMETRLCVPPSYDDFPPRLKEEYGLAFALFAEFDNKFSKTLMEVFERIYLKRLLYYFPQKGKLSRVVEYLIILKKVPDALYDFCARFDISYDEYNTLAVKLQTMLDEE